jgi:uncharacterized small protein (TIGR04563 family)
MTKPTGRRHSFYFPDWMSRELEVEAARLDRSTSWILQRAWKLARAQIAQNERTVPRRSANARPATPALSPVG